YMQVTPTDVVKGTEFDWLVLGGNLTVKGSKAADPIRVRSLVLEVGIPGFPLLRASGSTCRVVFVWRSGRGTVVRYLHADAMRAGQWRRKRDAGAGDLCTHFMSMKKRSGKRNCRGRESPDAGDNRRLGVRAAIDCDGLPFAEPIRAANRNGLSTGDGGAAKHGAARGSDACNDCSLQVVAVVDHDRLTRSKALHAGYFDIGCACRCCDGQSCCCLYLEVMAVAAGVCAIRKTSGASGNGRSKDVGRPGSRNIAATLLHS